MVTGEISTRTISDMHLPDRDITTLMCHSDDPNQKIDVVLVKFSDGSVKYFKEVER